MHVGSRELVRQMYDARNQFIRELEDSMNGLTQYTKESSEKQKTIENLVKKVLSSSDNTGACNISDAEGRALVEAARKQGIPLAEKYTFTKVERDELVNTLKAEDHALDIALQRKSGEGKEMIAIHKQRLELIAAIIQIYDSIVQNIAHNIQTAARTR